MRDAAFPRHVTAPSRRALFGLPVLLADIARAEPPSDYDGTRAGLDAERARLRERWHAGERSTAFRATCAQIVSAGVLRLARFWLGTTWGLGAPQIERPVVGRVNCGTFVGRLLADAGFQVHVRTLQRQPSALIARTFSAPQDMRRFSRVPVETFVGDVHEMGPGLFILGLDYHVGLLVRPADELRFVHASVVSGTVVDEPAATAVLVRDSGYRVVGKALGPQNLTQWLFGLPIPVVGGF